MNEIIERQENLENLSKFRKKLKNDKECRDLQENDDEAQAL